MVATAHGHCARPLVQAQSHQQSAWQSLPHPEFALQPSLHYSRAGGQCSLWPLGAAVGLEGDLPVPCPHVLSPTGTGPT